ncbi:MAG: RidA family protein [Sphingobacteriales bacterium]|nr:MAG: RidA family protein [Sphingobacteriales bacterium]
MSDQINYINPEGLFKSPAFSQAVTVQGKGKTIYIGGQNAADAEAKLVGCDDIGKQTEQAMKNIQLILEACGAGFQHLVKMTIFMVDGQDVMKGFEASQKFLGQSKNPPAVSVVKVAALGRPEYLVEIEGIAFLPE